MSNASMMPSALQSANMRSQSGYAAAIPLPDDEIEARRRELQQLTRNSLAWRAFTYFMSCGD